MASLYYIIWKEGKYFVSQCLNVDVSSFGDTRDEAIQNLNEAVELYFEEEVPMQHEMIESPEIISVPREHA
jgi:predicted RNase H-like HicB family nuclease